MTPACSQFRWDVHNSCKQESTGKRAQLLLRWLHFCAQVHNSNSEKWSVLGKIRGKACVRGHESYNAKTRISATFLSQMGLVSVSLTLLAPKLPLWVKWHKITTITRLKIIHFRHFRYQSKARVRLPVSEWYSRLHPVSHRLQDIVDYWSNFRFQWRLPAVFNVHSFGVNPWIQDCEI